MPTSAVSTQVIEDYLKAIYQHTEWQDERITPSQLAQQLGLAPSSVTEMVQKLAAAGLVSHRRYGPITLTAAGTARAAATVRRHRLVETWLVREYGYTWDEVHDEAEVLEHVLSDRLLDRIDDRLGRPRFDPHGDAIPDAQGRVQREAFVLLAEAAPGHVGRVLRVSDRDPELLRDLERLGVDVGREVEVAGGAAGGQPTGAGERASGAGGRASGAAGQPGGAGAARERAAAAAHGITVAAQPGGRATSTDAVALRIGDVAVALPAEAADAIWLSA